MFYHCNFTKCCFRGKKKHIFDIMWCLEASLQACLLGVPHCTVLRISNVAKSQQPRTLQGWPKQTRRLIFSRIRGWSSLHFHRVIILPMARNLIHHGGKTMPHIPFFDHGTCDMHLIYTSRFYSKPIPQTNHDWGSFCIPSQGPPTS